jgi:hypothetical protein
MGVQAASAVTISSSDPRLKRVGPSQYELTLSLSKDSAGVRVQGGLTDAQGNVNTAAPTIGSFIYGCTQRLICSVSDTGLVTPTALGSCDVYTRWPIGQVNAGFPNAEPNLSNFAEARIALRIGQ